MGILSKAVGIGLAVAGLKKIKEHMDEKNPRRVICRFDGDISKEEFYIMVKRGGGGIPSLTDLYAEGSMVYGVVSCQQTTSSWRFRIDFSDDGELSGAYRIFTDVQNSDIPKKVADCIAQQIIDYPECINDSFLEELCNNKKKQSGASCPYCGRKNNNEGAKFCMYCGCRFRI